MKKISFLLLTLSISGLLYCQNTNNIWYFGENAGIDFNYGIEEPILDGQLDTREGCATICDNYGNLLFYTDGTEVFNRNHEIMPNGSELLGDFSAAQSCIIVPLPSSGENENIYYIFTVDSWGNDLANGLRYSILDMTLANGLGDITSTKNVLLHDLVVEKIVASYHNNGHDVWLLTHDWGSNDYLSYLLTDDGLITEPIISSVGFDYSGNFNQAVGNLKFSDDGLKVVSSNYYEGMLEVFHFNNSTGELSDAISFNTGDFYRIYGVEFSPNGSFLYYTSRDPNILNQLDIQVWDYSSILNSNEVIVTASPMIPVDNACALQTAPNGKIYISRNEKTYLSAINSPNEQGLNCNFEEVSINLNGRMALFGLPNFLQFKDVNFITGSEIELNICQGDSVYLGGAYQHSENTYHDTLISSLDWDSIVNTTLIVNPIPDTYFSIDGSLLTASEGYSYQWFVNGEEIIGAYNQEYTIIENGDYSVEVENEFGCSALSEDIFVAQIGISENEISQIFLYPNPMNDVSNIYFERILEKGLVQIFSASGTLVRNYTLINTTKFEIVKNNLSGGSYIIVITKGDELLKQFKLVVN